MELPGYAASCIRALEAAGYAAYAVGGCVRDDLMGIPPHDFDLCTSALPEQTSAVFSDYRQIHAGMKHGTVGVITDGGVVEITTFRAEGSYQDNRHPDWVDFVPEIEQDLARRDYTMNAIAWSPTRGYADPFGGREDISRGVLRAVGDPGQRYQEDSLRILRGIRFAARFHLEIDDATLQAMFSQASLMENLARERVFEELCGFLTVAGADELLRFAPILAQVIPELAPTIGFDQHSPHHAYDVFTHTAYVFDSVPHDLTLRWAALLHDIGKVPTFTREPSGRGHFYGHAPAGAQMAEEVLTRLKAPKELRQRVVWLIGNHMNRLPPDKKVLRRWLSRHGEEMLRQLFALQNADMNSKGIPAEACTDRYLRLQLLLEAVIADEGRMTIHSLAIDGNDLMHLGYQGKSIGDCLNYLLEQVMEEALPNEKEALLIAAKQRV